MENVGIYFITLETEGRQPWLSLPRTRDVFLTVLRAWQAQRNGRILAATVLPDHAHILVELPFGQWPDQVVAGWKSGVRRGAGYAQTFQENYREYQLKEDEVIDDYGLYMFLAAYRARLLTSVEVWGGWWAPDPAVFKFTASLNAMGGPLEEWTHWPDSRFARLAGGL